MRRFPRVIGWSRTSKPPGEGASGGISGLANIALGLMQPLLEGREEPKVDAMVEAVLPYAVTAAVKALVGLRPEEQDERSREGTP